MLLTGYQSMNNKTVPFILTIHPNGNIYPTESHDFLKNLQPEWSKSFVIDPFCSLIPSHKGNRGGLFTFIAHGHDFQVVCACNGPMELHNYRSYINHNPRDWSLRIDPNPILAHGKQGPIAAFGYGLGNFWNKRVYHLPC